MASAKKINACVGINIEGNILSCAVLTKNQGFVFIEEIQKSMFEMGSLTFEKETSANLKEIFKRNAVKVRDCSVIIPDKRAIVKNLDIGVMSPANIYKSLPLEFQEEGAGPDFLFDYAITSLNFNAAKEVIGLSLLAMGVDSDHLLDQKDIFKAAGANLHTATCKENALSNVVRSYRHLEDDLENKDSFCFIEIGYTTTKVVFFKGTTCQIDHTRTLNNGIKDIEDSVARAKQCPDVEAKEFLKNNLAYTFEDMEDVVAECTRQAKVVRETINFYNAENFGSHVNEAICMGIGTNVRCLINYIGLSIGVPFDTATNKLSQSMQITGADFDQCIAAIGAALQFN